MVLFSEKIRLVVNLVNLNIFELINDSSNVCVVFLGAVIEMKKFKTNVNNLMRCLSEYLSYVKF